MKAKGIFLLILSYLVTSCTDENIANRPDINVPENKILLELKLDAGDYIIPSAQKTKSENEMGDNVWVLVFEGSQKENAEFKEIVKTNISSGALYVMLTKSTAHSHVMVIANVPDEYYNNESDMEEPFDVQHITTVLTGKTLGQCQDILYTTLLPQPTIATIPYTTQAIPMAGLAEVPGGIIEGTVLSNSSTNKLHLTRIVAKADVRNTSENFQLLGFTVIDAPRQGSFFSLTTNIHTDITQLTDYPEIVSSNPVYLYESTVENNTSVIIKGKYNDEEYYYKLGFIDDTGNLMAVHRNKYYKFEITSITGPGKKTLDEARAETVMNVNYHIVVLDDSSHDIISNGKYYLGVSNSELIIYGEGSQQDILAFTVNTDATAGMGITPNTITSEGVGLTLANPSNSINLSMSSVPGSTDVKIDLTSNFESGVVNIQLGDLIKTVKISRRVPLSYTGEEVIDGNFISAVITGKGNGEEWLSLSADGIQSSADEITLYTPGPIYIMAPSNITTTNGNNRIGGEFFLVGKNDEGRIKYIVSQSCLNTAEISVDPYGYVGAFWRKNQTGERLIRIPYIEGTEGAWSALVLEGKEWIKLDAQQSSDPNIGWKPGSNESAVADMNSESNDERYQVSGEAISLNGMLKKDGYIYFRIGLKSTYSPTTANPARYGVVLLSYNDNRKFSKIYIRQGEDEDYLMSGAARPLAKKFSPYNLTAPNMMAGGVQNHEHSPIEWEKGTFTKYPTQAGAFLQYANQYNQRFGYHPVNPMGAITGWQNNYEAGYWDNLQWKHRSCPTGWRRPNDGSTNSAVGEGNNVKNSEMRQSLYANPPEGSSNNMDNAYFGYYADGFFDRRKIMASPNGTPSCAVSTGDYNIAYSGYVFFNPSDNSSLFFPVGGQRAGADGRLQLTGTYGAYWSVTAYTDQSYAWALTFDDQNARQMYIKKSEAVSIRCIKDK